jgi:polysaccharide export outer membrane protein
MTNQDNTHDRGRACAQLAGVAVQRVAAVLMAVVVAVALGCATPTPPPLAETPAAYRIGAPDALSIGILPEPEMRVDVTVRPDGMITIPLIGDVPADGRTIPEITVDIEQRMGRFKRGAQVSVALVSAQSTDITMIGEFSSISSFPLVKATRVVEAIGQVGGTTTFASDGRIRVIRTGADRTVVIHPVDLKAIRGGDLSTNMLLEPGDIVYAPPTVLARIGYMVQQLLFPFQPVLGIARVVGGNILTP